MTSPRRPNRALAAAIGCFAVGMTALGAYMVVGLFALAGSDITFESPIDYKIEVRQDGDRVQVGLRVEQPAAPSDSPRSTLAFSWEADANRAAFSHESSSDKTDARPKRTGGVLELAFDRSALQRVRGRALRGD